ncbi:MAG: hypothetical protein U0547_08590 [Dehalococcoidia bacterium]
MDRLRARTGDSLGSSSTASREPETLAAAGYADGFSTTYQYTANRYGKLFNDIAEAQINYLNQIGIKTTTDVEDYDSSTSAQTFSRNFKGIAFGYETPFPEAGSCTGLPVLHRGPEQPQQGQGPDRGQAGTGRGHQAERREAQGHLQGSADRTPRTCSTSRA